MATKITVWRERLLNETVLAVTVNEPSKLGIVGKRNSGGTLKESAQFNSPNTIQFVGIRTIGVTGEPLRELAN
ncbi:hypothetical protein [Niveibacterium umoris]|uniref:Uncharacterized protein n=1 Tax=Niveibacterium umoris TaxID=1193620 RepID=A0A840BTG1_9RHOO|nr:hypothetical protein [Niveibacterium umoris]MBB4014962.1 hypothetical protein [Niveibacterium umoris]